MIQRLFAAGLTVQSIAGAVHKEGNAERLTQVVDELDDTIRQIRTSIFELHGSPSREGQLRSAVLAILDQLRPALGFRQQ